MSRPRSEPDFAWTNDENLLGGDSTFIPTVRMYGARQTTAEELLAELETKAEAVGVQPGDPFVLLVQNIACMSKPFSWWGDLSGLEAAGQLGFEDRLDENSVVCEDVWREFAWRAKNDGWTPVLAAHDVHGYPHEVSAYERLAAITGRQRLRDWGREVREYFRPWQRHFRTHLTSRFVNRAFARPMADEFDIKTVGYVATSVSEDFHSPSGYYYLRRLRDHYNRPLRDPDGRPLYENPLLALWQEFQDLIAALMNGPAYLWVHNYDDDDPRQLWTLLAITWARQFDARVVMFNSRGTAAPKIRAKLLDTTIEELPLPFVTDTPDAFRQYIGDPGVLATALRCDVPPELQNTQRG